MWLCIAHVISDPYQTSMEHALALPIVELPKPFRSLPDPRVHTAIRRWLCSSTDAKLIATDGSKLDSGIGGVGLAYGTRTIQTHISGVDQTSWAAQLEALTLLLVARATAPACNQHVRVIVDCLNIVDTAKAVMTAIVNGTICTFEYPRWGCGRWQYLTQILDTPSIDTLEITWLPSRGKHADWAPPDDIHGDVQTYRKLNSLADTAAKSGAAYAQVILAIESFDEGCIRAQERAESALTQLSLAVHRYLEDNVQLHTKCAQLDGITLAT
jgi:hypothetical protein